MFPMEGLPRQQSKQFIKRKEKKEKLSKGTG